jgi:hypothetical protein
MPRPALVIEVTGEIDFESRDPFLVEETGRRWRLEDASGLLIGDLVTVAATKEDYTTLRVRALSHAECPPYHRHH